jgi:hypothetical protein
VIADLIGWAVWVPITRANAVRALGAGASVTLFADGAVGAGGALGHPLVGGLGVKDGGVLEDPGVRDDGAGVDGARIVRVGRDGARVMAIVPITLGHLAAAFVTTRAAGEAGVIIRWLEETPAVGAEEGNNR